MTGMRYWAVVVPAERYEAERLYHHETVELSGAEDQKPNPGDDVLLVAATEPPVLFGLGRIATTDPLLIAYTRRNLDEPRAVDGLDLDGPLQAVTEDAFWAAAARLAPLPDRREWLVSMDLPIEAESPGEAVRLFWTYVRELGPRELPVFVSPADDELAMQAYVLGGPTNLDPEEDDD
jgi:hypothetical protein